MANTTHFDRRGLIQGLSLSVGLGLGGPGAAEAPATTAQTGAAPRRPNLILFFPDELRADALACYGNPVTHTPNFDALARGGARFAECHVQNPVCAQSRCSLLTGWPTSVRGHRSLYFLLQRDEPNMFRYLRQAGYDVFWFGKNDALVPDAFTDSVTEWHDLNTANGRAMMATLGKAAPKGTPTTFLAHGGFDRRQHPDYDMVTKAIAVMNRRESDKPFCIFLPTINPHPPYMAPQGFDTLYDPAALPPLVPPGLAGKPAFHTAIREAYGLNRVDDATLRRVRAAYYGQVSYTDWLLGELLEAMAKSGRDKDTALIIGSDHGDYAGDYGLVEKWPAGLETALTHVPLIARVPGAPAGVSAPDMVELFDIMATMLELGGTKATHTHFARSLMPQIMGGPGDPQRAAFTEGGYNLSEPQAFEPRLPGPYLPKTNLQNDRPATIARDAAVRDRHFTYIERPDGPSELYDRRADPRETRNLADHHAFAPVRDRMRLRLLDWYINTSGVPNAARDRRDMPVYKSLRNPWRTLRVNDHGPLISPASAQSNRGGLTATSSGI